MKSIDNLPTSGDFQGFILIYPVLKSVTQKELLERVSDSVIKLKIFYLPSNFTIMSKILPIPRYQLPFLVSKKFIRDYEEIITRYEDEDKLKITLHLLEVLEIQQEFNISRDPKIWKQYALLEKTLLERYGPALKPYTAKQLHYYFDAQLVLSEKNIYTAEVYNSLRSEEQILSVSGMEQFIKICMNVLTHSRDNMLLSGISVIDNNVNAKKPLSLNDKKEDESDNEYTKARQLLAIYYILKTLGIEHRENNSVSGIARLAHLLTGTKLTKIQNSDIYKKYLLLPNYNKGEALIKDLHYIRPFFEEEGVHEAVKQIDKEISRCIKELPLVQRKKWEKTNA